MSATEDAVSAFGDGIARLAEEDRKAPAEQMAIVLLAIDSREARDAFTARSADLGGIETVALAEAMLDAAKRRRHPSDWPAWLDPIPTDLIPKVPKAGERIDALAQELWEKATAAEEPIGGTLLDATLSSLSRLAGPAEDSGSQTAASIVAASSAPIDTASAEAETAVLDLAMRFVDAGLATCEQFSAPVLDSLGESLRQPLTEVAVEGPLPLTVVRGGARLAPYAGDEARDRLGSAAEESAWLPEPYRATLVIAAAIREDRGAMKSPYAWDEIEDLLIRHGDLFASGAAIWIERLGPSASEVGKAIRPLAGDPIPSEVGDAIDGLPGEADADRSADLVLPSVERLLKRVPAESFLRSIGIERADAGRVMSSLVALYGEGARSNEDREKIVGIAELLRPLADTVRKQFILDLIIPLAHQGKEALDIAVRHLDLCLPPPRGTKGKLRDTLRERAKGKDQKARVDKALLDAGLIKRSGFFGRGRTDTPET